MQERRYSRYKQTDVFLQLAHYRKQLKVEIVQDSVSASGVSLIRKDTNKQLRCAVLARSSDWYQYSLNSPEWQHGCTAVVVGTHDSCLPVPALALDVMRWYEKGEIRAIFGPIAPTIGPDGKAIPDRFDRARKSAYGHNMLIGCLMMGKQDALDRLQTFNERTRFRIEAEIRKLHHRRRGRPLVVSPIAS
ncbi:MAG TPA: hypothetical protein VHV10_20655 [Ktedonobacteraceae bacterium]|jgi:hypothetical protein|nr:hypothetical protein [Ktedonobacteraceae bacterium]